MRIGIPGTDRSHRTPPTVGVENEPIGPAGTAHGSAHVAVILRFVHESTTRPFHQIAPG